MVEYFREVTEVDITRRLFELEDKKYRDFQSRLMPTVDPSAVIGVRTPLLRNLVKKLKGTEDARNFLLELPHKYYEENNLHGFLVSGIKDFHDAVSAVDRFLPYVDNWSTCDTMTPYVFGKHTDELLPYIKKWLASGQTYTVRYGIRMLMSFYLGDNFAPEYPEIVLSVNTEEYYVHMMVAWYFATALAKQYERVVGYIEDGRLDIRTHNKAITKANESYRLPPEHKEYLKTLRK